MILLITFGFETRDGWFSADKFKHFFTSYMFYSLARETQRREISVSITFTLGLSKEIYDGFSKEKFSYKDLIWDVLGIGMGLILVH